VLLFIGDDWAEDHHDLELEDETGRRLAKARLPEGLEGITRFHALVAQHAPADWADLPSEEVAGRVVVGIETDRGPWVTALRAAGYRVFAINPLSSARYRERYSTSGAKSDAGDAHVLAEIVRLDRDHHRQIAGDTDLVDAVKLVARAHQTAIWERTRQVLRLRSALREYFPAAIEAFGDLSATDTLILLARAPSPVRAGKLTRSQVVSRVAGGPPASRPDQGRCAAGGAAGARPAATLDHGGRLRGRRCRAGRHHHRVERADHAVGSGGGRAFWPAPGR
jgi:transposase